MKHFNTLIITILLSIFFVNSATAQVSPLEQTFAERVAMRELDKRCNLFTTFERRAMNAFVMQARGDILRQNWDMERVNLLINQAKQGVANKPCSDPLVQSEANRLKKAYNGWKSQFIVQYPGEKSSWTASRAGVDNWRAWQDVGGGVKVGYVLAQNGLAFAVETNNMSIAGARVYLRNSLRIGLPTQSMRGKPALRIGTDSYIASYSIGAQTKRSVSSNTENGKLFVFSNDVTRKTATLDPRDYYEVELFDAMGRTTSYVVEVGDVITAFAFGAEF